MAEPDLLDLKPGQRVVAYTHGGRQFNGFVRGLDTAYFNDEDHAYFDPTCATAYVVEKADELQSFFLVHPGNIFPI